MIFSGSSSSAFTKGVCEYLGIQTKSSHVFTFSEGNTYVQVRENVREKDVFIIQSIGFNPNNTFMELLFWIDAFKRASAQSVTVIMPFFSYAKADKKDEPRVSIRARVCADCLESVGADRVITMDLHSPQIQGFFKIPVDHLLAFSCFCEIIKRTYDLKDCVIVSPDAGFSKNAERYSEYLDVPLIIMNKVRSDHSENAIVKDCSLDLTGKHAIIVDDFSISFGTIDSVASMLIKNGVTKVSALVVHNLLTERGVSKLENSPISELIVTNTVDNPFTAVCSKVKTISVSPVFGEAISRITSRSSLSELFSQLPEKIIDSLGFI
jgi:ribose-phosphate pyrophosphokinase